MLLAKRDGWKPSGAVAVAWLLLALFLGTDRGFAQTYDVVGLVMDAEKGEPIVGARIYTQSGKLLGTSNSTGRFEITVNSDHALLVLRRQSYKDLTVDLGEFSGLVDIEVSMESAVLELAAKDTTARRFAREAPQGRSMEELEKMQGLRIDLNDHLRQLHGVSGMNEFTNDISVYGSRTQDVTHYLGQSRIPSLRHLDFGFPGNQSVINPRLLKSVTLSDNLAKGPINQGNSSALVYDLREGDPENITGNMVFGTVNRELTLTGYWEGRTYLASGRYLEPTFLSNLGEKFFTEPKEARLRNQGHPCDSTKTCRDIRTPFDFRTFDGYLGTFYRDTSGAFSRHSFIGLDDEYEVIQDMSNSLETTDPQTLIHGAQDGMMYTYEALSPFESGDLQYSLGIMKKYRQDAYRDTLAPVISQDYPRWYPPPSGQTQFFQLGDGVQTDLQVTGSFQWNSNSKLLGASYGYGLDFEYQDQDRTYLNVVNNQDTHIAQDYGLANALLRLRWTLGGNRVLEAAGGAVLVYQGISEDAEAGLVDPAPLASLRYSQPLARSLIGFGEVSLRQNTSLEPVENAVLTAYTTTSVEGKLGANGNLGEGLTYATSVYSRVYKDPILPVPEVNWNYRETQESDFALASGGNVTLTWTPLHQLGMNVNASVVQGDYHLTDGNYLPWEANRSLDLVSNLRFLPRRDSLLSIIFTYGVNNDAPLYEYTGLWDADTERHTGERTIRVSRDFPTVSRQRMDMRINLDLKSKWRPLEGMRFFFEADNIFADFEDSNLSWLGGDNQRRRGWTRAGAGGDLLPVVTRGMGLFIMFGFEGKLLI